MKIHPDTHNDIIEAYTIDLLSMQEIADIAQVSRAAIHKLLNKHGIDTSKHKITISCTTCGKPIQRTRKRVRKQLNHFCNHECYTSFLNAGVSGYIQNRHAQRLARHVVSKHFDLRSEHIVHHEDKNNYNNSPYNLRAFANQGDHIKYHHQQRDKEANSNGFSNPYRVRQFEGKEIIKRYHGIEIKPIWDGSQR